MKVKSFLNSIKKHKYKLITLIVLIVILYLFIILFNNRSYKKISVSESVSISSTIISDIDFLNTVKFGSLNNIRYMLEMGANPEALDENSRNAMSIAANFSNDPKLIDILSDFNVDINNKDISGYTPLMFAIIANNSQEFIDGLIKNGANVNATNNFGSSVLMIALALNRNNQNLIEKLIKFGAVVNYEDPHKVTPLMVALKSTNNPQIIEILIKNGAKTDAKDDLGISTKDILKSNKKLLKYPHIVELFQ